MSSENPIEVLNDMLKAMVSRKASDLFLSVGISGQIAGSRADLIVPDDIEVPNNSDTQLMRDKLLEGIKEFDAVLKPDGEIVYLGTPQSEDKLIYARPDQPDWGLHAYVTDDGHYLIYSVTHGTDPKNRFFYQDLKQADAKVVELLNDFDASYSFIENIGTTFYFHTDLKAPRYRVIAIDVTKPAKENWREIIPEGADKLDSVSCVDGQLLCKSLKDARSAMVAYDLEGKKLHDIELPGIGTVGGFGGKRSDKITHYAFTSFTTPGAIYRYDVASGKSTLWKQPKVDFDASPYETTQVFVKSKDGTKVPMFLVHKKGLKLDGNNATLLYGYGGFDISLTPNFSIGRAIWLELGGVYALANLRGGGEYGAEWHLAGTKLRKQNVFDDFIGCAEWLQKEGYTSPKKLAIMGGSNGGLLVGACMTQRPELYGAALPAVGVMDMLRYHKFTVGAGWASDYGNSDTPEGFNYLRAYSPLHTLKSGAKYPAVLVTTADHDDRVHPGHSFKYAAALQAAVAGNAVNLFAASDVDALYLDWTAVFGQDTGVSIVRYSFSLGTSVGGAQILPMTNVELSTRYRVKGPASRLGIQPAGRLHGCGHRRGRGGWQALSA